MTEDKIRILREANRDGKGRQRVRNSIPPLRALYEQSRSALFEHIYESYPECNTRHLHRRCIR